MTSQKEINIIISNEENLNSLNKDKIENSSILSPKKTLEIKSIIETSPEVIISSKYNRFRKNGIE